LSSPTTIPLSGSALPDLNATGDSVSAIGAGVIVDGQDTVDCFTISGDSNRIEGIRMIRCYLIGVAIYGPLNTIGGSLAIQRNVIGQRLLLTGIEVSGGAAIGNVIQGNYIGTNASGTAASEVNIGISLWFGSQFTVVGGTGPGEGNLISGATGGGAQSGIHILDDSNVVRGNKIGTNAAGTAGLPNGYGITVDSLAQGNTIGGTGPGEGNIVAFSTMSGLQIASGGVATVRGNSIHSNGLAGISSTAPAPSITAALGGTVAGTACALCIVDIYDDNGDEGKIYRASTAADGSGNFSISGVPHALANVTATATGADGLTSPFSEAVASPANADGDSVADAIDGCPLVVEDPDGYQDADGCPDTDNDMDGVLDTGDTGSRSGTQRAPWPRQRSTARASPRPGRIQGR
jgi:hypothetical protein